jgi:hypothetical protein
MALQPNHYQLKGGDITVTYLLDGFHNVPTLSYSDGQQTKEFSGAEIRTLDTEIGTLVSVTTFITIDTGATSFSVLLPAIELADRAHPQHFRTVGISTRHKGPDSFPLTGVRETYEIIHMHGTASSVLVPLEAVPAPIGAAAPVSG